MKAYSCLEFMADAKMKIPPKVKGILHLTAFYSQPFKPELITELFEGLKWFDYNNITNEEIIVIQFPDKDDNGEHRGIIYNLNNYWFLPRTLDDFITDCQRAGIELKWKEVIL